jgi:hypothetical protein
MLLTQKRGGYYVVQPLGGVVADQRTRVADVRYAKLVVARCSTSAAGFDNLKDYHLH